MPGLKGRFVCVWNCLIFFVGEYSSVWPKICRVLSKIQWIFLREISGKNYFGRIFQKFCANQGILWNFALLSGILFCVRIALKKFTQVLSYVVCTQVRRHVHKKITIRRYGGEKPGRFVFGKSVLFTLGLGLTTPYSLGIFVWKFYQTFFTVSTEFWQRFEPQIRPTGLAINFLFVTAMTERKVRLCVKLFEFFRGRILIRFTWNLSPFVPNWVEILSWNFRKKPFRKNFSEILCKPRLSSTETCEMPPYFLQFYYGSVLHWKKFTQVLSYVVCTKVRRHVHKQITKKEDTERKS